MVHLWFGFSLLFSSFSDLDFIMRQNCTKNLINIRNLVSKIHCLSNREMKSQSLVRLTAAVAAKVCWPIWTLANQQIRESDCWLPSPISQSASRSGTLWYISMRTSLVLMNIHEGGGGVLNMHEEKFVHPLCCGWGNEMPACLAGLSRRKYEWLNGGKKWGSSWLCLPVRVIWSLWLA